MASADDQSESVSVDLTPVSTSHVAEYVEPDLPESVEAWLAQRLASASHDVAIGIAVQQGRWLVRVEHGEMASTVDHPAQANARASDVAASVRRWARTAGHDVQSDAARAGEVVLRVVPAALVLTRATLARS